LTKSVIKTPRRASVAAISGTMIFQSSPPSPELAAARTTVSMP
jgi:hypothetical protein